MKHKFQKNTLIKGKAKLPWTKEYQNWKRPELYKEWQTASDANKSLYPFSIPRSDAHTYIHWKSFQNTDKPIREILALDWKCTDPNEMWCATSRACQCSSGLKYAWTTNELNIRENKHRIKIFFSGSEEFLGRQLAVVNFSLFSSSSDAFADIFLCLIFFYFRQWS